MDYEYHWVDVGLQRAGRLSDVFPDINVVSRDVLYVCAEKPLRGVAHPSRPKAEVLAEVDAIYAEMGVVQP